MADADESMPQRRRLRLRWWHPLVVVLLAILLPLTVFLIRFANGWDLEQVQQRATRMGIDWHSTPPAIDDDILSCLHELEALLDRNGTYRDSPQVDPDYTRRSPHAAVPMGLLTHHAQSTAAEIARIRALVDQLARNAGSELPAIAPLPPQRPDIITLFRQWTNWTDERLLLAPAEDIRSQAIPTLDCIDRWPTGGIIGLLVKSSCTAILVRSLTERLPALQELPEHQRIALASALRSLRQYEAEELIATMKQEWSQALYLLSRRNASHGLVSSVGLPASGTLWVRYGLFGRSDYLDDQLDRIDSLRHSDAALQTFARFPELYPAIDDPDLVAIVFQPERILCNLLEPAWEMMAHHLRKNRLHRELLAAELTREPWPPDPFTPGSQPLQRRMIDGRLLAAYSIGTDGIDDDGDPDNDMVVWLYGHQAVDGTVIWGKERLPVIEASSDQSLHDLSDAP